MRAGMALPAALPLSLAPRSPLLLPGTSTRRLPALLKARLLPPLAAHNRFPDGHLRSRAVSPFSSLLRYIRAEGRWTANASTSGIPPSEGSEVAKEMLDGWEAEVSSPGISFLAKLAIALGIAATVTLGSAYLKWSSSGSSFSLPLYIAGSSQSGAASSAVGFTFSFFGYKFIIPEFTPGWVYFWLLMTAGCGLFISEEALVVWVCPCPLYWYMYVKTQGVVRTDPGVQV